MSDGVVRARLAELGLTLHGPHPPHDPLDAVVVYDGVARTSGQLPRIEGELTCRRFASLGGRVTLQAASPEAAVIVPREGTEVEIWGVVTTVIKALAV